MFKKFDDLTSVKQRRRRRQREQRKLAKHHVCRCITFLERNLHCCRKVKPMEANKIGFKPPVQNLGKGKGVPDMQLSFVVAKN